MPDPLAPILRALDATGVGSSDFDLHPDIALPPGRKLRPAGVLVAFEPSDRGPQLILTKRASHLKHHPGQIAFPGGKQDDTDADVIAAALREAEEEVALPRDRVEVLGTMPEHETVTGFRVTPVLARVAAPFTAVPEAGEVDEVFRVPLDHVANLANYSVQARRWQGRMRSYYTVPYGPYYIWGATARMLKALAERMAA